MRFDQLPVGPRKGERPFPVPGEPPRPLSRRQRTPRRLAKKAVKGDPVVGIGMSYGSHLPLNHRAHPKFLPKRTAKRLLEGLPRAAPPRREGPQSPQESVGRATHQEERAVRRGGTPRPRHRDAGASSSRASEGSNPGAPGGGRNSGIPGDTPGNGEPSAGKRRRPGPSPRAPCPGPSPSAPGPRTAPKGRLSTSEERGSPSTAKRRATTRRAFASRIGTSAPKAIAAIAPAVDRPIPGSASSASTVRGTVAPWRATRIPAARWRFLARE